MFSSLSSIDFEGLCGLGASAPVGMDTFLQQLWNATPTGTSLVVSESAFKDGFRRIFGSGFSFVKSDSAPSGALSFSDILAFINNDRLKNDSAEDRTPLSQFQTNRTKEFFDTVMGKGYYILTQVPVPPTVQASSEPPSSETYSRPVMSRTVASPAPTMQPTEFHAPQRRMASAPKNRQKKSADKNKLMWVLGVGGLVFAITIGVLASD